jgi:serine protease Do
MSARSAWVGAVLGLLVGAALGGIILATRADSPWLRPAGEEAGNVATQATPRVANAVDSLAADGETPAAGETLQRERSNAIVLATRQVAPAVVSINVIQQQSVRNPSIEFYENLGLIPHRDYYRNVASMGSGLIVTEDGLIVTNQHVVEGALQIIVTLSDGSQYQAVLLDAVDRYDLAVLKIEARGLPVARLADEDDLVIGEWAIAIGSPYGYLLADTQPTVTVGVISALNRDIKMQQDERAYLGMIQTDAAINPGNSGGPLVNTAGEVVGINTFIFSGSGGSVGIGFAVPAARVAKVIEEINLYGRYRQASMGLQLVKLEPEMFGNSEGVDLVGALVYGVQPGSPAWKAGLRPWDILREVAGVKLVDLDTAYRLFYDATVGDVVPFLAERNGTPWTSEILMEEAQ